MIALALMLIGQIGTPPAHVSDGPGGVRLRRSGADSIEVIGLDAAKVAVLKVLKPDDPRWSDILSLRLDRTRMMEPEAAPIVGRHVLDGSTLRFIPRYPLQRGTDYLARYGPDAALASIRRTHLELPFRSLPRPNGRPTSVVGVDPRAEVLPENLLKIYIQFSGPMSRGEAYERVRLLDDHGKPVRRPFLEIGEELWNGDQTRLTLLLDPGRIKRGLRPHEEEGPILESGKVYTLIIDSRWADADGRPLTDGFRMSFRAGLMDTVQPDPSRWTVGKKPKPHTRDPIAVRFPEPLDRAMLARAIVVLVSDKRIEGKVEVPDGAKDWRFVPDRDWPEGPMTLWVDTELEDLAGNSVARPFESTGTGPKERPKFIKVAVPAGS